ncbi:MAG: PEP/pyruvate-binding domain-containing protein, partial [Candidatus Eremiobacterota bacterium]
MLAVTPESADDPRLGGKGRGLARLAGCGMEIPRTACIAPDENPDEALRQVLQFFSDPEARGSYAVRSSGGDEDGAQRSFAGQLVSHLRVTGPEGLRRAVEDCRRSGGADRVLAYAGAPQSVSVLIQPVIPAEYAGVLFTCDPVTGSRNHLRLDAVPGTAEELVSGHRTGWSLCVGRDGRAIWGEAPFGVEELVRQALLVEQSLGGPLDFEWALAHDRPVWLQVRPVTGRDASEETFTLQPGELPPVGPGECHWTSLNAREALPGVATPLFQDLCPPMLQSGFRAAARMLGVEPAWEGELAAFFHGRAFLNVTAMGGLVRQLPLRNPEVLVEKILGLPAEQPAIRPSWPLLRSLLRTLWRCLHLGRAYRDFQARELAEFRPEDLAGFTGPRLLARVRALMD